MHKLVIKIKNTEYPNWVSGYAVKILLEKVESLVSSDIENELKQYKGSAKQLVSESLSGLFNCFTDERLKYVWEWSTEVYEGDQAKGNVWLAMLICNSFKSPNAYPVTKTEGDLWKHQTLGTLKKLKEQVQATPPNYLDWTHSAEKSLTKAVFEYSTYDFLEELYGNKFPKLVSPPLFRIIDLLINELEEAEFSRGYSSKKVSGEGGHRIYFIKAITSGFLLYTDKKHQKVVTDLINCAFECQYEEREVRRYTKELNKSKAESPLSEPETYCLTTEGVWENFLKRLENLPSG